MFNGYRSVLKKILKRHVPASFWDFLRRIRHWATRFVRSFFEKLGYLVARKDDYYSPLPNEIELHRNVSRWAQPSNLRGIKYDLGAMRHKLGSLVHDHIAEFSALPSYESLTNLGFGPGFTHVDAFTLYSFIRQLAPVRYLEVGSGLSTYYCSLAREQNRNQHKETEIVCVEPYPYPALRTIDGIKILQTQVQSLTLENFENLCEGDVLFIDSSHVVKIDGDVPFLFLEVLPALSAGVYVHIHDIPFPFNVPYPPEYWTLLQHERSPHWPIYWTEAMLLQALLINNHSFEIVLSCPLLRHFDEAFLRITLPLYRSAAEEPNTFSSIWLRKLK